MATHQWWLTFDLAVPEQLTDLPRHDRMAVFYSIKQLLEADNPAALPDVRKRLEKRHAGLWRKRQGNYRILFAIQPGQVIYSEFAYKGTLHLIAVLHRSRAYG